ncbi:uncharacterized protein LOC143238372 isoform X2 [Tachypleus tridentatus]|uniref:uncharacterized protein LOC143238372 isoform X2 n=1 Tax=Tachypleus tridentatus TaxID=6853 RepID=UPI003FD0C872
MTSESTPETSFKSASTINPKMSTSVGSTTFTASSDQLPSSTVSTSEEDTIKSTRPTLSKSTLTTKPETSTSIDTVFPTASSDQLPSITVSTSEEETTGSFGDVTTEEMSSTITDHDPCDPNPCENGGSCMKNVTNYTCKCSFGFVTENCSKLDYCKYENSDSKVTGEEYCASKNATCENNLNKLNYKCTCNDSNVWDEDIGCYANPCDENPCLHGGTCTNEKNKFTCVCTEKYIGRKCEAPHPCNPNPCENNGNCIQDSTYYTCDCPYGFIDYNCTTEDYCEYRLENNKTGNEICKEKYANCTNEKPHKTFTCSCGEYKYFDYNNSKCRELNPCLYKKNCTATNEVCEEMNNSWNCSCKDGYKTNGSEKCEPINPCENKTICSENEECFYDVNYPSGSCRCKRGYEKNEHNICTFVLCDSGNNTCSEFQKCSEADNTDMYSCVCIPPFSLDANKTSCVPEHEVTCPNKCGNGGECVIFKEKETCICKKGYEEEDGTCVEYCQSKKWKENPSSTAICPTGKCKLAGEGKIKCLCEPSSKWEETDDEMSCRLKSLCNKGQDGQKECSALNAECELGQNYEKGYQCRCPKGTKVDSSGHCKSLCDFEEHKQPCKKHYADCVVLNGIATCQCKPSFLDYNGKLCKYANVSYAISLFLPSLKPTRVKREAGFSDPEIHISNLKKDVDDAMKIQYGENFVSATILNIDNSRVDFSLNFKKEEKQLDRIKSNDSCLHLNDKECILPPNLTVLKQSITDFNATIVDQCKYPEMYCYDLTVCSRNPNKLGFSCSCVSGYEAVDIVPLSTPEVEIQICKDIDECNFEGQCQPNGTECVNIPGDFLCQCKTGFKKKNESSDIKRDGCIGVCDGDPCGSNGNCSVKGSNAYTCSCEDGYFGEHCEQSISVIKPEDTDVTVLIVLVVVLGCVLFLALIFLITSRLKKRLRRNDLPNREPQLADDSLHERRTETSPLPTHVSNWNLRSRDPSHPIPNDSLTPFQDLESCRDIDHNEVPPLHFAGVRGQSNPLFVKDSLQTEADDHVELMIPEVDYDDSVTLGPTATDIRNILPFGSYPCEPIPDYLDSDDSNTYSQRGCCSTTEHGTERSNILTYFNFPIAESERRNTDINSRTKLFRQGRYYMGSEDPGVISQRFPKLHLSNIHPTSSDLLY